MFINWKAANFQMSLLAQFQWPFQRVVHYFGYWKLLVTFVLYETILGLGSQLFMDQKFQAVCFFILSSLVCAENEYYIFLLFCCNFECCFVGGKWRQSWYDPLINYADSVLIIASSMPTFSVCRLWFSEKFKSSFPMFFAVIHFNITQQLLGFYFAKKSSLDCPKPSNEIKSLMEDNLFESIQSSWQTIL